MDAETLKGLREQVEDPMFQSLSLRNPLARELLDAAERLPESEVYAKEGWDWLNESLAALGAKNVFEIKAAGERVQRLEQALREIAEWDGDTKWKGREFREWAREALNDT